MQEANKLKELMTKPRKELTRRQRKERAEHKRIFLRNVILELMLKLKYFYIKNGWPPKAATNNALGKIDIIAEELIKDYPEEAHLIRQVTNKLKNEADKHIKAGFKDYFHGFLKAKAEKGKEIDVKV